MKCTEGVMPTPQKQLDPIEEERYSRHFPLASIGYEGQVQLRKSRATIVGLGGLGNLSSMLLSQMGIGYLRLVDRDVVELSNLPRTPLYQVQDIDLPKAEQAKLRLFDVNPSVETEVMVFDIDEENVSEIVDGVDVVLDGLDSFQVRMIVMKECRKRNIPFIFTGAVGANANLSTFTWQEKEDPCLICLYGGVDDAAIPQCENVGVHPAILSIATAVQVSEAVRILTKQTPLLRRKLSFYDLDSLSLDEIEFAQRPDCPVCSQAYVEMPKYKMEATELCGHQSYYLRPPTTVKLDISNLMKEIEGSGKEIIRKSSQSVTWIETETAAKITMFTNGRALIRGVPRERAEKFYGKILKVLE